jgi:hypothetical protein
MSPPNNTYLVHQEGRIALAIEALNQGRCTSVRAAAKSFDVTRSTFQYRLDKYPSRHDSRPTNCKLTETEELTLVEWILSMDERGLPASSNTVQQMANLLLQKRCQTLGNPDTVGQRWVYNFVQRHRDLKSRYNRKYENTIAKYGILDEDIYNFDETGFQMGVISTAKVITGTERSKKPVSIQPGNREWVTVIDCISVHRWALSPVIIFEGKLHQSTWYSEDTDSQCSVPSPARASN